MEDEIEYGFAQELIGFGIDSAVLFPGLLPCFFLNLFATCNFHVCPQPSFPTSFWMEWNGNGESRESYKEVTANCEGESLMPTWCYGHDHSV